MYSCLFAAGATLESEREVSENRWGTTTEAAAEQAGFIMLNHVLPNIADDAIAWELPPESEGDPGSRE